MSSLAKRPLGDTGISVSCLGLGTVKIGRNQEVKYPSTFSLPSDNEVQDLLALAKDLGINLLDTAPAYGSSEQRLGRLLTDREHWIVCSKVGEEFLAGKSVYNFQGDYVKQRVERSLRDLQTDYLDMVLIHSDGNDLSILDNSDCVEALQKLKEAGLVRSIGMSSKTVEGGIRALELMDMAMVTYHAEATDDGSVIDYAAKHNRGILIKKAMNSGHLSLGEGGARKALDFALSKKGVSSVIVGTINPEHLRSNVESAKSVTD
ncbi:MAG: aldo/keto reductase [Pseudomonadales bacterium]|nr:aldo/keto reductase [Pseudomonadales bacterium]